MKLFNKISSIYRDKLSYKLKLFLPVTVMLWILVAIFAIFQFQRGKELRQAFVRSNVDMINNRIIALCNNGEEINSYVEFIDDYYDSSKMYTDISIAVYRTDTGEAIADVGFKAPTPAQIISNEGTAAASMVMPEGDDFDPSQMFYYKETMSPDGQFVVQTILPYNEAIKERLSNSWWWWIVIFGACVIMTVVIYFTTSHVAKNVKLLNKFATRAVDNVDLSDFDKFGNDDLGDIGRKILSIYNSRRIAQAARELEHNVALKATEERATIKRQLTDNISHELKTPVGVVKGYIETMVENPDMDEDARRHFLLKAQSHVERLCNLLNDLSTMTRLDSGSTNIVLENVDMRRQVENVKQDLEESGTLGGMTFVNDVPEGIVVKANSALLTGALMNLAKNAVNYSKGTEMGVKLLTTNSRIVTFVFYDNGTGVDDEHIPHLFERFYRVDKGRSRKAGGTGLGLPIVRSSIKSMKGSITVRNRDNGGLEFVFALYLV